LGGTLCDVGTSRVGQQFGDWRIAGTRRLGGGGRAVAADGRAGAIKILIARHGREGQYRLARFKDEIDFLLRHPDFDGVLAMLDGRIADDLSQPSWYVMPVATPIQQALGADPGPRAVVAAVAKIASTLQALAEVGVSHRDIKPANLFMLNSQPVIGDFGLVTYPDKDPRTQQGRKLGPTDCMAPEMRRDSDTAAPGPADAWALAKTLWVLLTSQDLPQRGARHAE
jgi:serine/threonine protein kinase